MECAGDNSCESDPLIDILNGIYIIDNSFGMLCAVQGCKFSTFNLFTNIGGAILCSSFESCFGAMISITNIDYLLCGGVDSCKDANILIINPNNGFSLFCQSSGSCQNLKIDIMITDPSINIINQISCGGSLSCHSINVKITKRIPQRLQRNNNELRVRELICGGNEACFNGHFELSGNVIVSSCRCAGGASNACNGLIGVDSC